MNVLFDEIAFQDLQLEKLASSSMGREFDSLWFVNLLYGHSDEFQREIYVVKLQSKLNGQSVYLRNDWVHDLKRMDQILSLLNKISVTKRSHIRYLSSYIETLIKIPSKVSKETKRLDPYLPITLERGVSAYDYYVRIQKHVASTLSRYPLKTQKIYESSVHEGVVLNGPKYNFSGVENDYWVAIRSEVFRKLIGVRSDKEYRKVLEGLYHMDVIDGDIDDFISATSENMTSGSFDEEGNQQIKRTTKKSRMGKRVRVGEGDTFITAIILKVSKEWTS